MSGSQKRFEEGDVVELKSGGPSMTIAHFPNDDQATCDWFVDGKLMETEIYMVALKHSLPKETENEKRSDQENV